MTRHAVYCLITIFACALCHGQALPTYDTVKLPSGEKQDIYTMWSFEGVSPVYPVQSRQKTRDQYMSRYRGLIYPTRGREFFATDIDEPGYYLFCGVFGVYDDVSDLTGGPTAHSDVTAVPLVGVDTPGTFIFHAEAGETWAAQAMYPFTRRRHWPDDKEWPPTHDIRAAAVKADTLKAGGTVGGSLADAANNALFTLDVRSGKGYRLAMDCTKDADYDLYLLRPASDTASLIVDSSTSRVIGMHENAEQLWVVPEEQKTYLALVRHVSGSGEFELTCTELEGPPPKPHWTVTKDDDGERDSYWGQVTSPIAALHKILMVEEKPSNISRPVLQYSMGYEPYDPASKSHLNRGAPAGKEWPNLVVTVNGEQILSRPVDEVATMGWHEVAFDPQILKQGKNIATFTLGSRGTIFYMAIDLDSNRGRSYCTRDGEKMPDTLRPVPDRYVGPGEYMVRLKHR